MREREEQRRLRTHSLSKLKPGFSFPSLPVPRLLVWAEWSQTLLPPPTPTLPKYRYNPTLRIAFLLLFIIHLSSNSYLRISLSEEKKGERDFFLFFIYSSFSRGFRVWTCERSWKTWLVMAEWAAEEAAGLQLVRPRRHSGRRRLDSLSRNGYVKFILRDLCLCYFKPSITRGFILDLSRYTCIFHITQWQSHGIASHVFLKDVLSSSLFTRSGSLDLGDSSSICSIGGLADAISSLDN